MPRLLRSLHSARRYQHGNVAPFLVLALGGALLTAAYALDTSRMVDSSAQLKRATDEAALAVGHQRLLDDTESLEELTTLAQGYVSTNLGMDKSLADNLDLDSVTLTTSESSDDHDRYTVTAQFKADSSLLGASSQTITVHSTAEVISSPTEIALVLPNTETESDADIATLKRLGQHVAEKLLTDANQTWLSLVPYSQSVNVYDNSDTGRLKRWAMTSALTPVELRSLFRSGKASSLADARIPDRVADLLCMYRGLEPGENFDWDQSPVHQFYIHYRHDLPANGSPGADPISWVGPNPDEGVDAGAEDTRWMVADKGCPNTPLLPLTDDIDEVEDRLDEMTSRFNVNYAIAMAWAGAALSPEMRGSNGWGDEDHPLDFNASGNKDNQKVIIMLANTTGDWFDTDSYNFYVGKSYEDYGYDSSTAFAKQRFIDLCNSFQDQGLKFYFIGVRPGDPSDFGRTLFDQIAGPGLQICAFNSGAMKFADATSFSDGEDDIESELDDILSDIQLNNAVRLVE